VAKKSDKATFEQRVTVVIGLIIHGVAHRRIVPNIAETWGIEHRQARNYVRAARRQISALAEQKRKTMLADMIVRHDDLREKGYAGGDHRLVLDVDKEDAKLLGLYPAEKHEHDITGIDNAIARELARLVGGSEAGAAGETEGA